MKRIYKVTFEEKWRGCGDWIDSRLNVLGDGDALAVVPKVKAHVLAQSYKDGETGKLEKCTGFRLLGIEVAATADI